MWTTTSEAPALAASKPSRRLLLIGSDTALRSGESAQIFCGPMTEAFQPSRLVIDRAAEDWVVDDIRVDWERRFRGPVEGILFSKTCDPYDLELPVVASRAMIVLIVTYVGADPDGVQFRAVMLGTSVPDQ